MLDCEMRSLIITLTCLIFSSLALSAQQPAQNVNTDEAPKALPVATEPEKIPDDGVRVAILGYHDFSITLKETEMRINTDKFRKQMQALKDQGLSVISMQDFQAWKRGEKTIPPRSVVITIDDGWISVYTDAYPILKEFGYPFTVFLYTKYVNAQGRSMSFEMIQEMQKNGCYVGNHSTSHPYPVTVKSQKRKGPQTFASFLEREMGQSKAFLEKNFKQPVNTYCYPGGFHTDEMFEAGTQYGYDFMFTVLPGKIKRSSDNNTLPRYIILGTYDRIFDLATEFRDAAAPKIGDASAPAQKTIVPVQPEPGAVVNTRLPVISIDLSTITDITPESLVMRIAGFGDVPAVFDENTKQLTWQVNRRLRTDSCQVSVTWKGSDKKTTAPPVRWTFAIDKEAAYQPTGG